MRLAVYPSCTHEPLLVRLGAAGVSGVAVVARDVPIVPAAVEGCSLSHLLSTPRAVAREAGTGGVIVGLLLAGNTRNPPYEQLLVGLEAAAESTSMFRIGGRRHVSVTWHREGGWLVLT
jgi:hypothetical protein